MCVCVCVCVCFVYVHVVDFPLEDIKEIEIDQRVRGKCSVET